MPRAKPRIHSHQGEEVTTIKTSITEGEVDVIPLAVHGVLHPHDVQPAVIPQKCNHESVLAIFIVHHRQRRGYRCLSSGEDEVCELHVARSSQQLPCIFTAC
eukprot:6490363-Amphidinium_carterae.4